MTLHIVRITKETKNLYPMLEKAYRDIYLPSFPCDETRESLQKFKDVMEGKYKDIQLIVNILGENLDHPDPNQHILKGISIAYYYEKHNVGSLAYNAIDPKHRQGGLGKLMVQSRIKALKELAKQNGKKLAGVFIDVHDPAKVTPRADSLNPTTRIDIFKNWGAKIIPFNFIQPPLEQDGYYSDILHLMNYPIDGRYADKKAIAGFLHGLYTECYGGKPIENDPHYAQMVKEVQNMQWHVSKPDADFNAASNDNKKRVRMGYNKNVPKYKFVS